MHILEIFDLPFLQFFLRFVSLPGGNLFLISGGTMAGCGLGGGCCLPGPGIPPCLYCWICRGIFRCGCSLYNPRILNCSATARKSSILSRGIDISPLYMKSTRYTISYQVKFWNECFPFRSLLFSMYNKRLLGPSIYNSVIS